MVKRPDSVLAAGILILGTGLLATLLAFTHLPSYDIAPVWQSSDQATQQTILSWMSLVGSFMTLVCGIYILQGHNWARWFYGVMCVLLATYDLFFLKDLDFPIWPAEIVRMLFVVVLFLPNANRYFAAQSEDHWR